MHFSRTRHSHLPSLRPLVAASLSAILMFGSCSAQATVTTGSLTLPRMYHQASAMLDGRVLYSGGYAKPGTAPYASAEIYDPATGLFAPIAPMQQARVEHAAVTLQDGRVLVMGGSIVTSPGLVGTNTAELYDPATGQWTYTGNMNTARWRAIARLLPDGRVFVMNKDNYSGVLYAEVYDPQTGTFSKTGNVVENTGWHGLVVMADGRVMKVGGYASDYSRHAEIWDPATNLWSATGNMNDARQDISPILLPDGKIMVAGGSNISTLRTTDIYDPATGLFTAGSLMPEYLSVESSAALPNGDVVVTGAYTKSLMHYQVSSGAWNSSGPKRSTARATSVTRLADGNLLLAGGAALNDATTYAAIYDQACAPSKLALAASAQNVGPDGGLVSWTVTAAPGCRFEATDLPAWLTPVTGGPMQMPAEGNLPVSFSAVANASGAARTATFMLGNNTATVTQPASPTCPSIPTVSPASFSFTSSARTGTFSVSAGDSCPWTLSSLPSWVSATSNVSGTGNGSVAYAVAANTGAARMGNGQLDALGLSRTFTMSQDAPPLCPSAPTLSPSILTTTSDATSGTINVTAAATCPWSVGGLPSWVTQGNGASGTGNGSFAYAVAANTSVARTGAGSVTGPGVASTLNINQGAGACATWSVSVNNTGLPASAYSGSIAVTAAPSCSWSVAPLPSWITITSGTSGTGNGSINYTAAANTGAARSATSSVIGSGPALALGFSQAAAPGPACSSSIASGVPVNGNLQPSTCAAGARGASYYTDRYTFTAAPGQAVTMLLTSPSFDTYMYLRNPAGTVIKSDDDGGGNYNSRIPAYSGSYTLPAGTAGVYTIEVTSYGQYRTGAYTLSFTQ